jgi:hypothetical protein
VQLTQLQDEVINAAHCEGHADPASFAGRLLHDLADVDAANDGLVNRRLMAATEGGTFSLTDQGEAVHRAQENAHRADVISRTRTWQRR